MISGKGRNLNLYIYILWYIYILVENNFDEAKIGYFIYSDYFYIMMSIGCWLIKRKRISKGICDG